GAQLLVEVGIHDFPHVGKGHDLRVGGEIGELVGAGAAEEGEILEATDIRRHEARAKACREDAAGDEQEESGAFCHLRALCPVYEAAAADVPAPTGPERIPWP